MSAGRVARVAPTSSAAQVRVDEDRPVAVPPVEGEEARSRPAAARAASRSSSAWTLTPAAPGRLVDVGRDGVAREPGEDVADRRLARLVAEQAGHDAVLDDAAHPLRQCRARPEDQVAGARAHHRDHRAGLGDADRRHRDVGVDVGDGDRRPRPQARSMRRPPPTGRPPTPPSGRDVARHLVVDDAREARVERAEERRVREPVRLRPDRLVAGRARVARLDAGQPPDDPVGRLDEPVGRRVDVRRLVEDLEALGVEPLRRDPAAVARQPRPRRGLAATALIRSASGWAAWCFHSLTQACGSRRNSGQLGTAACRRRSSAASCRR